MVLSTRARTRSPRRGSAAGSTPASTNPSARRPRSTSPVRQQQFIWMSAFEGITPTEDMNDVRKSLLELEREQENLIYKFLKDEDDYVGELNKSELEFGKMIEKLRNADLKDKKSIRTQYAQERMTELTVDEEEQLDREREAERLVEQRERDILSTFEKREIDLKQQHERRMAELRARMPREEGGAYLGVELADGNRGPRVVRVRGPGKAAGIREGDILHNLQASRNVTDVHHAEQAAKYARTGDRLAFLIEREGVEHEVVLVVPKNRYMGW